MQFKDIIDFVYIERYLDIHPKNSKTVYGCILIYI